MKQLLIAMVLVLVSPLFAEGYWVQVLSLERLPKMDAGFEAKLKALGYDYRVNRVDGMRKVQVGAFGTYQEAKEVLWPLRCKLATDAFIVKEGAQQRQKAPMPMQVEVVPHQLATVQQGHVQPELPKALPVVQEQAPVVASAKTPCQCVCDPKALRKAELVNALEYYKHSKHYKFDPATAMAPSF